MHFLTLLESLACLNHSQGIAGASCISFNPKLTRKLKVLIPSHLCFDPLHKQNQKVFEGLSLTDRNIAALQSALPCELAEYLAISSKT